MRRFPTGSLALVAGLMVVPVRGASAQGLPDHWYRFENNLQDSVGTAHGAPIGNPTFAEGRQGGRGLRLDGSSEVTLGNTVGNFGTGDFSVAFWINAPPSTSRTAVFSKRSFCTFDSFVDIRVRPPFVDMEIYGGQSDQTQSGVTVSQTVFTGSWFHLAFTRQGLVTRGYVNGTLRNTLAATAVDPIGGATQARIGGTPCLGVDGTVRLNGTVDEFMVWSRAITGTEVAGLFNDALIDFDGDGVPRPLDNQQFIYNPAQDAVDIEDILEFQQMYFEAADGAPLEPHSDDGLAVVTLPNDPPAVYYVTIKDGLTSVVENFPWFPLAHPFETESTRQGVYFPIGPLGVDLSTVSYRVTLTRDPIPWVTIPSSLINQIPTVQFTVTDLHTNGGAIAEIGIEDDVPPPPPQPAVFPATRPDPSVQYAHKGFEMADLNRFAERNSCAPGAVGSSFTWLRRTYDIGGPQSPDALRQALEEMRIYMGTPLDGSDGTSYGGFVSGKEAYIKHHALPLVLEGQGSGSPLPNAGINPLDMYNALCRGQDVEFSYEWTVTDAEGLVHRGAHTVALIGMTPVQGRYLATIHDDLNQSSPGSNDTPRSGMMGFDSSDVALDFGTPGRRLVIGWIAESPTRDAVKTAVAIEAGNAAVRTGGGLRGGGLGEDESRALVLDSSRADWLAVRLVNITSGQGFGDQTAEGQGAIGVRNAAAQLLVKARHVHDLVGQPGQAGAVQEADESAQTLLTAVGAFESLFPPDADDDDVPDAIDNCELANPDQADCDGDGVGDVCELLSDTDHNFDGVPDSCQCLCDWNRADGLDSQDFFDFLDAFFNGDADINGADGTDSQDFFDFLECFFDGCSD